MIWKRVTKWLDTCVGRITVPIVEQRCRTQDSWTLHTGFRGKQKGLLVDVCRAAVGRFSLTFPAEQMAPEVEASATILELRRPCSTSCTKMESNHFTLLFGGANPDTLREFTMHVMSHLDAGINRDAKNPNSEWKSAMHLEVSDSGDAPAP